MDLVNEKAAARLFGVHVRTVRRWGERGLITRLKTPSGRVRYLFAELVRLAEGGGVSSNVPNVRIRPGD